jgi:hypothetical protein
MDIFICNGLLRRSWRYFDSSCVLATGAMEIMTAYVQHMTTGCRQGLFLLCSFYLPPNHLSRKLTTRPSGMSMFE